MPFDAGAVVARLELNTKQWEQSIARVKVDQKSLSGYVLRNEQQIKSFGKSLSLAGGAVTAAMGVLIKKTADVGDEINDLSQRTGIATDILSGHKLALDKSGSSLSDFAIGMRGLANQMQEANSGNKLSAELFDNLGVSIVGVDGKLRPLNDVMLDVAERLSDMPDGAEKTALAMDVFGRSGMNLIPFLNEGKKGLQENYDITAKLGGLWSKEAASAADDFNDSVSELKTATGGLGKEVAMTLLPSVKDLIEKATSVAAKVGEWAREHQGLAKWIGETALKVGALAVALGPILIALPGLIKGVQTLKILAANTIVISVGGFGFIASQIKKGIEDWNAYKDAGSSAYEEIAKKASSLNPLIAPSFQALYRLGQHMEKVEKDSVNLKGIGILLGDAWKYVKEQFDQAGNKAKEAVEKPLPGARTLKTLIETTIPPARDLTALWARMGATITASALPPARDLSAVLKDIGQDAQALPESVEPAVTETSNMFDGLFNDIASGFGNTIQSWLEGAMTFKDFMSGLWGDIKSAFFRVVGEMVAKWVVGLVQPLVTSAAATGASITASLGTGLAAIGTGLAGLVTSLVGILPAMATAIASAATILAAAAPAILVVGAIALGLYAGVKLIGSLIGGAKGGAGDGMGRVVERQDKQMAILQSIIDFCRNDVSKALLQYGVDYMGKTMDAANRAVEWLSTINGTHSGLKGAYNGAGPLTSPQLVMTHGTPQRPEYIVPEPMMSGGGGQGSAGAVRSQPQIINVYLSRTDKLESFVIDSVKRKSQTNRLRGLSQQSFAGA